MIKDYLTTSLPAKTASVAVRAYPFARGRHRLRQLAASTFLIAKTGSGHWVRVSGVSGFEWKIFERNFNEPRTIEFLSSMLKPGMNVFDVGANIGFYTLMASRLVGPEGRVHAFEPSPNVASRLRQNARINRLHNVTCNEAAVSDSAGQAALHLHREDSEGNSIFKSEEHGDSIAVSMITLDDYVQEQGIARVDVLKIDAEGAEPKVLRGSRRLLTRDDAPVLLVENNPQALRLAGSSTAEVIMILKQSGYECWILERLTLDDDPVTNLVASKTCHGETNALIGRLGLPRADDAIS